MITIPAVRVSARRAWRLTQITARILDLEIPRWWANKAMVAHLIENTPANMSQCWQQHVTQRQGE